LLARVLAVERPRLLVLTPNFQNPTGASIPSAGRHEILQAAARAGVLVVENDTYGELRYRGQPLPAIKQLDSSGVTVLLRSFSKIAFPGLRVGWAIAPAALAARLAEAKQSCDLHTDQLSQAVLLCFAQSGRLRAHRERIVAAGGERLAATLAACERFLPSGSSYTRPEGGMNLWVRLPAPLDASELLSAAQRERVSYLPGRYFEVSRRDAGALRLSFAGLAPSRIRSGVETLGEVFSRELARARPPVAWEPEPAVV
jgi:DNA-binding transcriptional MocR family regulator